MLKKFLFGIAIGKGKSHPAQNELGWDDFFDIRKDDWRKTPIKGWFSEEFRVLRSFYPRMARESGS